MGVSLIYPQTLICPRILPAASNGRKKCFPFIFLGENLWRGEQGCAMLSHTCIGLGILARAGSCMTAEDAHHGRASPSRQSIPRVTEDPNRIPRVTEDPDHTRAFPE